MTRRRNANQVGTAVGYCACNRSRKNGGGPARACARVILPHPAALAPHAIVLGVNRKEFVLELFKFLKGKARGALVGDAATGHQGGFLVVSPCQRRRCACR